MKCQSRKYTTHFVKFEWIRRKFKLWKKVTWLWPNQIYSQNNKKLPWLWFWPASSSSKQFTGNFTSSQTSWRWLTELSNRTSPNLTQVKQLTVKTEENPSNRIAPPENPPKWREKCGGTSGWIDSIVAPFTVAWQWRSTAPFTAAAGPTTISKTSNLNARSRNCSWSRMAPSHRMPQNSSRPEAIASTTR